MEKSDYIDDNYMTKINNNNAAVDYGPIMKTIEPDDSMAN